MDEKDLSVEDEVYYFSSDTGKTRDSLSRKIVMSGICEMFKNIFERKNSTSEENPLKLTNLKDWQMPIIFNYLREYENKPEKKQPDAPLDAKKSISAILGDEMKLFEVLVDAKKATKENLLMCFDIMHTATWLRMDTFKDKVAAIVAKFLKGRAIEVIQKDLEYCRNTLKI